MSKMPHQHFPLVYTSPNNIKKLILSLQEVCRAKNLDFRTIGIAKTQHVMAEALGYGNWQELLASNISFEPPRSLLGDPENPLSERLKFTKEEWSVLARSTTGRWALDEVILFNKCRQFLENVENYFFQLADLAWSKPGISIHEVPAEDRPQHPKGITLTYIEAEGNSVEMNMMGNREKEFTVNLMLEVGGDQLHGLWGVLTHHTWTTYRMGLNGDQVDYLLCSYYPEIVTALQEEHVI